MLKNLLKTWAILAPDEIIFPFGGQKFYLKNLKENDYDFHTERLDETEVWTLQGYLQRCIGARGWYFSLQQTHDYCKADVRASIEKTPYQVGRETNDCHEVLLTAYLTALAAQRPITPGQWRHFKGDVMDVKAVASPTDSGIPVNNCMGIYTLEDAPEQTVILGDQGKFSTAYWDYKDRVFYQHGGRGWARATDNFLGLVGSNHPEHEGLLRFVEVSDAGIE